MRAGVAAYADRYRAYFAEQAPRAASPKTMLAAWLSRMQPESHRALWDMSMFSLPNLYAMHRPPMLILGAEDDVLVPAFLVQTTGHTYSEPVHIFRDMGHAVTHEKEWPLVAATLQTWLENLTP